MKEIVHSVYFLPLDWTYQSIRIMAVCCTARMYVVQTSGTLHAHAPTIVAG